MEAVALVAPVTALEFLQDSYLLTGEGPVLSVYCLQPRPKACASLSVLQHYRIHGIRPAHQAAVHRKKKGLSCTTEASFYDLAVFGGKAIRLVRLHVGMEDGEHLRMEILGPLTELQDWALDICWLSGDDESLLCVAAAHNRALLLDIVTGKVLAQCSCVEGCLLYSALLLVHESWTDTVLVGGTVFNQLVIWKPGGGGGGGGESSDSEHKAPVKRRLLGHSGVIFSICYLQDKGYLASASDDRSVRVWGVGALGGSEGECGDLNPACLRVLYGHQARVFSVCLSPGKLFSAGEDGACLVWDWAEGGKVVRTLKGHRAGGVRALAVSEGTGGKQRWVATGGADGGVRLWKVEDSEERKESTEEAGAEKLTDLKFPAHGLPKVVRIIGEEDGDTGWSQFVVCTDKGVVHQYRGGTWDILWRGTPDFQSYCVMETITVSVKDSATKVHLCAVGNLSGLLHVFPTSHPQCGVFLTGGSGKIHSLIWQKGKEGGVYLLASGAEGLVYRWRVEVRVKESGSSALSVNPLPRFLLPPCAKRWLTAAVLLQTRSQEELWVCGDRRGSLLLFQDRERSDEGPMTDREQSDKEDVEESGSEKREDLMLQPLSCVFGVHGKQGVTSVCEYRGLLYSTGRDGCVRVFRVRLEERGQSGVENEARLQLEVLRVQRACRGMEWLERILILESDVTVEDEEEKEEKCQTKRHSLTEEEDDNGGGEARFVIVGFHAVHFVVWDPVKQERLMAVPCGGGHRSWSLSPSHRGVWSRYGALVFIKQGAVLASHPPGEAPGGTGGWGLREGVHGRGIGCVCRLGRMEMWEIVVTGGEDTSLTVLAVHATTGTVKVLSVITDHISSVRTVTAVTRPEGGRGNPSLSALLVSAGGRAQIQCYRLLIACDRQKPTPSCQVIQVAKHRLDEQWERRRNRHKTVKPDPETRYMSMAVLDGNTDSVLLALSCSDGAVRLFSISEVKHKIDLLWEMFYHQRCVLSVATCSLEDDEGIRYQLLFSAATDGKIAVWNLTEDSSSLIHNSPPPIPCLDIPTHQSGVNTLAVWKEEQAQQGGGCLVTVASGGDDGQLTVSTIRVQYPGHGDTGDRDRLQLGLHSQSHVPLAHAAPLTALRLLSPGLVVSVSSDQRVCLWKVCDTGVSHRGALCCHVADAAGLAVWRGEGGGGEVEDDTTDDPRNQTEEDSEEKEGTEGLTGWVLVCGQGLQLLRV